ncbi:BTB/POZ and MATH domain-containing protein 2 [Rhynchospora pubera]|uniref:BTB/POZ and MATH domain-containing protein 2 n=1 Tax=Rhynchospora pubera TaxID=906938 RepID=A0AAV8GQD3_9POAL|nr:BTB/POZ and MATH domain-containing protein 2 [Rhynchospora pubera]
MMTSTSELATGSHIFKVTGYSSLIKEIDVGQYISSSTFTVGGHEFYIKVYPQGVNKEREDFIFVSLMLNSDAKELPVQCEFGLVDMSGDSVVVSHKISLSYIVESKGQGFGSYFKRTYLETSQYLKDNCFMVRCTIRVVRATGEEDRESLVPPSNLHLHLAKLFQSGVLADVTFEVDEESFSAHRIVLAARSPVFEQLLSQKDPLQERWSIARFAKIFR